MIILIKMVWQWYDDSNSYNYDFDGVIILVTSILHWSEFLKRKSKLTKNVDKIGSSVDG